MMIAEKDYLAMADRALADLVDGDGRLTERQAERFVKWLEIDPRWSFLLWGWEIGIWTFGIARTRYWPKSRTLMLGLPCMTMRIRDRRGE